MIFTFMAFEFVNEPSQLQMLLHFGILQNQLESACCPTYVKNLVHQTVSVAASFSQLLLQRPEALICGLLSKLGTLCVCADSFYTTRCDISVTSRLSVNNE